VNALAIELIARLRGAIELVPGAPSVSLFEGRAWSYACVAAATEDTCYSLAELLGAPPPKERRVACEGGYHVWFAATIKRYERGFGEVQIDIISPRRDEPSAPAPAVGGAP
jgi:hypothetical protein